MTPEAAPSQQQPIKSSRPNPFRLPVVVPINSARAWLRRNQPHLRKEDGSSLIEFALTIGVTLTLVFVLMQLCLALYSYGMISETAREATRWAILRGSTCVTGSGASCMATTTTITNYAKNFGLPDVGGGTLVVTTTFPDNNPVGGAPNCQAPGCRVRVAVSYIVPTTLPLVPNNAISLQTSSEMRILQ